MKFSINNLLSKYNLVLLIISILIILLVVYIVLNVKSYKEHMRNPFRVSASSGTPSASNTLTTTNTQTTTNTPTVNMGNPFRGSAIRGMQQVINAQTTTNTPRVNMQEIKIIPEIEFPKTNSASIVYTNLFIPVCSLLNKNDCSKNNYCNWNSNKNMCNKLNVCEFLDKSHCDKSNNCMWNTTNNKCSNK
jgi:hypothetical protein